jgi:hypothetical protein
MTASPRLGFELLSGNPVVHSGSMRKAARATGNLVISLDFELLWGVRDHATRESYGPNVFGGRKALPVLLEVFERRGIKATWAIVGALLCENKDELLARAEHAARDGAMISRLDEIGADEQSDPYHFGASLARLIASCPGQEIGTHTFSHRCALEPGETLAGFSADVASALVQLREWGIRSKSIVFPRNQYGAKHLEICRSLGLTHFRGNEAKWYYAPRPGGRQTRALRICRLIDSYIDLSGSNVSYPESEVDAVLVNVASSRFLRPFYRGAALLDGLRLRRVKKAMLEAALTCGTFHLWWHPENFGKNLADNVAALTKVLDWFEQLRDSHGMQSRAMHEIKGGVPDAPEAYAA